MSAWHVSKKHIDALVVALFKYEVIPSGLTPDEVGKELWRENYRSVNYRYNEKSRIPRGYTCMHTGEILDFILDRFVLYKLTACYCYQTCEHPTWEQSKSYKWIMALEDYVRKSSGLTEEELVHSSRWKDAPWGI